MKPHKSGGKNLVLAERVASAESQPTVLCGTPDALVLNTQRKPMP